MIAAENTIVLNDTPKKSKQVSGFSEKAREQALQAFDISREMTAWLGNKGHERVSIGQYCVAAYYIRETALKTPRTYPFDWIGTTPEIVLHILQDDFKVFLDKNMMYSTGKNGMGEDQAGHRFYAKDIFFHMDPLKSERAYRYLQLSVHRFQKLFKSQTPIVFVTTVIKELHKHEVIRAGYIHNFSISDQYTIEDYRPVIAYATSINPNVKFFFLEQYTEGEIEMEKQYQDDHAYWLRFTSAGKNYGTKYVDNFDDTLAKILFKGLNT